MRFTQPDFDVFVTSDSEGNPYGVRDHDVLFGSGLYCETVIKSQQKLLIANALEIPEWKVNPDVKLHMISYLGFPLTLPNKQPFGTTCISDSKTNEYYPLAERMMIKFKNLIESHLEILHMNNKLGDADQKMTDYLAEIKAFRGMVTICSSCKSIKDEKESWHPIEEFITNHPQADFTHGLCPTSVSRLYPDFKSPK